MSKYTLGIRWDQDSTELSDANPGVWWADIWEARDDDPRLGGGSSQAVATKTEVVSLITEWQYRFPDHRLDLPATLAWFMVAPERPEYVNEQVDPPEKDRELLLTMLAAIFETWGRASDIPDWRENGYLRGQIELVIEVCRVVTNEEWDQGNVDGEELHDRIADWVKREVWK